MAKKKRDDGADADQRCKLMRRLVGHVLTEIAADSFEAYTVLANVLADAATGSESTITDAAQAIHTTYAQAMMIASHRWTEKERSAKEPSDV